MSTEWILPDISGSHLTYTLTSSVLEEFVQGHSISDVLREIAQNEYDAGGRSLSVTFGHDALEIHGNGRVIDKAGWRRLSVMLGTGHVIGQDREVPEKMNGIGSKNHGLRSLFLIGDEIYVRSGGFQTKLDLHHGTLPKPRNDEASAGLAGAHVHVPYRVRKERRLEPYDVDREAHDLDVLSKQLAPTLLKLADPSAPRSLREVTVSSTRCKRELKWKQRVELLRRHRLGGPVLRRTIVLHDSSRLEGADRTRIEELEYQKSYRIPPAFRGRAFPAYFRVSGGRVRIGISLRLKRNRLGLDHRGSFFYPLGCANGATGCAAGVNAPFEMNGDRNALIDPASSSWNKWLLQLAADFVFELLVDEWVDEFGPTAYLAVAAVHAPSVPEFAEHFEERLRERPCWLTRRRVARSRRSRFVTASNLVLGVSPDLDELVGDDGRRLDKRVGSQPVVKMALAAGAKEFTVQSAIRLRCAGEDGSKLTTRLGDAAGLCFTEFPDCLRSIELQEDFARTFDAHRRQLTAENRADLAAAPTTLTASGDLAAPSTIWVVDDGVALATPVGQGQRLHPRLAPYRTVRELCRPFNTSAWAVEVATKATEGSASKVERVALYRLMLRTPETIRRTAWPKLRRAPVIRDHRGDWVAPADVVKRKTAGARRLERALHFPNNQLARNSKLVRRLRFRTKVTGKDLLRYARMVAERPELAEDFEKTLDALRRLLVPTTVERLRSIPFLRSARDVLIAPEDAYVRGRRILACIGDDARYATGASVSLHTRLGCRSAPRAEDILWFLSKLRSESERGPSAPEELYPELVAALRAESIEPTRFANEPILCDGKVWLAPEDVLIGKQYRRIFLDAVPILGGQKLAETYRALGAHLKPTLRQWQQLFAWLGEKDASGDRGLASSERVAIFLAYSELGKLPEKFEDSARVFVDGSGRLHSRDDVHALRYLINDDPLTARVIVARGLPVTFADVPDAAARRFYRLSRVSLLTEARTLIETRVGEECEGPPWFKEAKQLDRLREPLLCFAVHALATAGGSHTATKEHELRARLRDLKRIDFVSTLERVYRIGRARICVPEEVEVDRDRIVLRQVERRSALYGLLSRAVATLADTVPSMQQGLADSIYRLLRCNSNDEISHYLAQRGIETGDLQPGELPVDAGADEDEHHEENEDWERRKRVGETLTEELLSASLRRARKGSQDATSAGNGPELEDRQPRASPLPPIADAELQEATLADWSAPDPAATPRGSRGAWTPRTPAEQAQDREMGTRGEELVYRNEVERVTALGFPASRVVWTSKSSPAADHDIRSVAKDGKDIWLEVKSTTGRDGRFDWPRAEFERALQARERYVLCRVYEAHTRTPVIVRVTDPVGQLLLGKMRLDISKLVAEVAPLLGVGA